MLKLILLILLIIPLEISTVDYPQLPSIPFRMDSIDYPYPYPNMPVLPYKLYVIGHDSFNGVAITKGQALALFTGQANYLLGKRVKLVISTGDSQSVFCFGFLNTSPSALRSMLDRQSMTGKLTEPYYVSDAKTVQTVVSNINAIGFTANPGKANVLLELK